MNRQSNFFKISSLLSIIFFCVFLFIFFFFFRLINNNNTESQSKEEIWQNETFRRNEIREFNRSVKIIEEDIAQLETHFAKSSDIVPFLDTIEGLAPGVGVKAEIVPPLDILVDKTGLMVGLKASGTFEGIYRFITLLENSPYQLEFIKMDMHKDLVPGIAGKASSISQWNAVFRIKLLSFVE